MQAIKLIQGNTKSNTDQRITSKNNVGLAINAKERRDNTRREGQKEIRHCQQQRQRRGKNGGKTRWVMMGVATVYIHIVDAVIYFLKRTEANVLGS